MIKRGILLFRHTHKESVRKLSLALIGSQDLSTKGELILKGNVPTPDTTPDYPTHCAIFEGTVQQKIVPR